MARIKSVSASSAVSSESVDAIRNDLDACAKNAAGRRQIPPALRERIVRYTISAGLPLRRVARDLELSKSLLHAWVSEARRAWPSKPVRNAAAFHGGNGTAGPRHVTVIAPNGLRIEGLTAQEAIDLVRATAS